MDYEKLKQMEENARDIGHVLGFAIKKGGLEDIGFALFLFSFSGEECTYIANADREDMLKMLKEFTGRLEAGESMPTTGEN